MPLPGFLGKIFSGGASGLIDSVTGAIDKLTLSKEEKEAFKIDTIKAINDHEEKMAGLAQAEFDSQLKDMADARNREIAIATSEKAPLLNKIIAPILGAFVVFSTFIIWALILFRHYEPKTNEAMVIGALTTFCGAVLNYYFGSSVGSKDKSKQIDTLLK